jgi:ribosomal protein S12 methylthiotransferase
MTGSSLDRETPASLPGSAPRRVGLVSLGCPKALVDSERILTRLKAQGYETSATYEGADAVVVNTCAFLDSARAESLDAIAEAQASGRPVIVTGCLGSEEALIRERAPGVAAITGAQAYDAVVAAVGLHAPLDPAQVAERMRTLSVEPFAELVPPPGAGVRLTPRHYAYLKIGEGCDHACSFCIIPSLRGPLSSRPVGEVLAEAERLAQAGVKELLVVSQDTSAYGLDIRYAPSDWRGESLPTSFEGLCRGLARIGRDYGVWARLHYVYPYPHVDRALAHMGEGGEPGLLPYLDIPFQHAAPAILKAMKRPAAQARTLERITAWRAEQPGLALRSTFVVGFPGETEADVETLLAWLEAARLDRVGVFAYENVKGAAARDLPGHVPEDEKQARRERVMAAAARISRDKLRDRLGKTLRVLVDCVAPDGAGEARTYADALEVDGKVILRNAFALKPGDFAEVRITGADAFDLSAAGPGPRPAPRPRPPAGRLHRVISRR